MPLLLIITYYRSRGVVVRGSVATVYLYRLSRHASDLIG